MTACDSQANSLFYQAHGDYDVPHHIAHEESRLQFRRDGLQREGRKRPNDTYAPYSVLYKRRRGTDPLQA